MEAHTSTDWMNDFLAGAVGGSAGVVAGHPFDTTKVQLQTQESGARYNSLRDALSSIRHHGIIRGFFRGLSYPLMWHGITNAIIFGVYGCSLRHLASGHPPALADVFLSGCAGGAAQLVIACPVDVIKCILQAQIPHRGIPRSQFGSRTYFSGPKQCLQEIWSKQGLAGLYKGLLVMAARDIPSYGLYLVCYETTSSFFRKKGWTGSKGVVPDLLGGGVAGMISWLSIMPLDVVKSRLQADVQGRYRGAMDCLVYAVRREGFLVLYRGSLVTCLRAFPTNASILLFYAQTLKYLNQRTGERVSRLADDGILIHK